MRLILLRHGQTAWNAQQRFQGQADPPLDEVGRTQAHEVAPLIAALAPDVLISSDAIRATATAAPIGALLSLHTVVDPRLRERSLGHWEGLNREQVRTRYPGEYADWVAGRDVRNRGGESRDQVAERARSAVEELNGVGTAVLITHSATAMALTAALLGMSQRVHVLGPLVNCHWSELNTVDHGGPAGLWQMRAHNIGTAGSVLPVPSRMRPVQTLAADADA